MIAVECQAGSWLGAEGYPLPSPHRGIDVARRLGADMLAAADGRVTVARDPPPRMVGRFDEAQRYPVDRLVLTYPVTC